MFLPSLTYSLISIQSPFQILVISSHPFTLTFIAFIPVRSSFISYVPPFETNSFSMSIRPEKNKKPCLSILSIVIVLTGLSITKFPSHLNAFLSSSSNLPVENTEKSPHRYTGSISVSYVSLFFSLSNILLFSIHL